MCKNALTDEMFIKIDKYVDSLPEKRGSLISVLHKAQSIFGYLPKEVQLHVARKLDLPASKVYGVVTFYSFFTEIPRGEHVVNVCMGTACFVRGAEAILREVESRLEIKSGGTTLDGQFSIDALRCVGACGLAPIIMVDGKVYGRVKVNEVASILKEYMTV